MGDTRRVAELLDRDPQLLSAQSGDGFSPLGLAAFFGNGETVKLLLSRGADAREAIGLAATKGNVEILKLLKGQP